MENNEKKLSKRQQKATEEYLVLDEQLRSQGYQPEKKVISILKANIYALLIPGPFALLCFALFKIFYWDTPIINTQEIVNLPLSQYTLHMIIKLMLFLVIIIGLTFIHELTHAFVWGLCTGNHFKDVELGMMWSSLTPYCHCKSPLKMWQLRLGAFMPFVTAGLIPYIIGMLLGSGPLVGIACMMMIGSGGDFTIMLLIRKEKSDQLVIDHPSECGCYVYRKTDV